MITTDTIRTMLAGMVDPINGRNAMACGLIQDIALSDNVVKINWHSDYFLRSKQPEIENAIKTALSPACGSLKIDVQFSTTVAAKEVRMGLSLLNEVKNIIVVASGKGGVGKSTTAVNLAMALHEEGAKVGLLDADVYGPSIPLMLGIEDAKPTTPDGKRMNPIERYGLLVASMGFLVESSQALIWRGPMVTQSLEQLIRQTLWGELDYLILDLPPGTGDVQLTLAQRIPVSGAVMVTTPQKVAVLDTRKSVAMFEKVAVPIIGMVENMATHTCSQCGQTEHIFKNAGGEKLAQELKVPLLGSLPLAGDICYQADEGMPIVLAKPQSSISKQYHAIALKMASELALRANHENLNKAKFPTIKISQET